MQPTHSVGQTPRVPWTGSTGVPVSAVVRAPSPTTSTQLCPSAHRLDVDVEPILAQTCQLALTLVPGAQRASATFTIPDGPSVRASAERSADTGGHRPAQLPAAVVAHVADPPADPSAAPASALPGVSTQAQPDLSRLHVSVPIGGGAHARLWLSKSGSLPFAEPEVAAVKDLAGILGLLCAVALGLAHSRTRVRQLEMAAASRPAIEQAKGILMGRRACSAAEAMGLLVDISQRTNTKLRLVAVALVEDVATATGGPSSGC